MEIVSFAQYGYEGELVKVEADLRRGIPAIDIVGLPDGAVREARERMRAAIRNSGMEFPRERILINLSPADLKKEGSSFDLPIALAVLGTAAGLSHAGIPGTVMVLGELELSGKVRPVHGVLAAVSRGLEEGISHFIVPAGNAAEAKIRKEAIIIGVESLSDAICHLDGISAAIAGRMDEKEAGRKENDARTIAQTGKQSGIVSWRECCLPAGVPGAGYEDVHGQAKLVRALQIAAAGGHHLLAYGPPGCGKTLSLQRFPVLLPDLDEETAVTVTRIHSIAGFPDRQSRMTDRAQSTSVHSAGGNSGENSPSDDQPGYGYCAGILRSPPFREPHQNASLEGMIGGGKNCRPGEISLAHGGVLFLDEMAQFRSSVLQALRTPLETGLVTISRAGRTGTFPASFQLLAAVNPCPCGNFGAQGRICTCTPDMIEKYWKRMTAPLLDRIDLRVAVQVPLPDDLVRQTGFSTDELREGIGRARIAQWERNRGRGIWRRTGTWLNAGLDSANIGETCALSPKNERLFINSMEAARLSGRGGHGILKVARTIADLAGAAEIDEEHILEAVQYRRWSGIVPDFLQER